MFFRKKIKKIWGVGFDRWKG